MKKFCVTISRVGCLFVMAENESDAMYIANRQYSDTVKWFDNWEATDVEEDDSFDDDEYITEEYE